MILKKFINGAVFVPMLCLILGSNVYAGQTKTVAKGVDVTEYVEVEDITETPALALLSEEDRKELEDAKKDADVIEELQIGDEADEEDKNTDEIQAVSNVDSIESKLGQSLGVFQLTGYCPCRKCNGNNPPVTRMGTPLIPGQTIAVDRRVIPLGTWVYLNLPGQGWTKFRAEDTGSGVKGNHIDVLRPTHSECFSAIWNSKVEVRLALA